MLEDDLFEPLKMVGACVPVKMRAGSFRRCRDGHTLNTVSRVSTRQRTSVYGQSGEIKSKHVESATCGREVRVFGQAAECASTKLARNRLPRFSRFPNCRRNTRDRSCEPIEPSDATTPELGSMRAVMNAPAATPGGRVSGSDEKSFKFNEF